MQYRDISGHVMKHLRIYQSPYPKIRIGRNNDGGYVVCDIPYPQYDILLSGGIDTDISFELALLKKYPNLSGYGFDGTIQEIPENNFSNRFTIIKKNISSNENDKLTNLREYFDKYNNIFMKMDIEGAENYLFASLSDNDLLKIKQLVIEFHSPTQIVIPSRLANTHWLVHLHPNNNKPMVLIDNIPVPCVFECTYIRKDDIQHLPFNKTPIPDALLDQPNIPTLRDHVLTGFPYVD
jgi:hypothetical protein